MYYTESKPKTNKIINGETVSYTFVALFSVFLFFALKQLMKVEIGFSASISVLISFLITEVTSFLLEKRFVFVKSILSLPKKQIAMFIFRAGVDFGFYKLAQFIFGDMLDVEKDLYWFITISLCFVFNYFFDRLLVFDCNYEAEEIKCSRIYKFFFKNRYVFLSAFITIFTLSIVYLIIQVFPFGDYTAMRMDLYHQYGPLFAELYQRVTDGKGLIYSWVSGGGSSFIGNYFNYLSSPLTVLIFLFDKKDISFAITFLISVKCVLSSVTFSYYLKKSQNGHNMFSASFGVLYAFCAYFLAYYWNVMWLDGMILFPIIILGIETIVKSGKCGLYIASLALLMYSSYYMGFMCCIFSVIYFICYFSMYGSYGRALNADKKYKNKYSVKALYNKEFFNRGIKFAASSLVAGLLCAATLIPVYIILRSSSATSDSFPKTFTSYYDIFNFLTSHLAGLETTIRSSGDDVLPNIYSGVLTCLLVPLYIVNKKIRVKEKTFYVLMLLFLLFSFDNNCMNFIWHAFHFPNDLPFRFSYMYSFLILVIAFRCLARIDKIEIRDIGFVGMGWIGFIILAQKFPTTKMNEIMIYLNIAFVILWTAILYLIRNKKLAANVVNIIFVLCLFSEAVICDINALPFSQKNSTYVANYDTITSAVNTIHRNDDGFYREELCYVNLRMDPCYYNYNGMSTFSSMAYESYSKDQYRLGMDGNRINSYTYNPQTPVYNMMFNIKYLMRLNDGGVPSDNLFEMCDNSEDYRTAIYKNRYYLPIAFCVNSKVSEWQLDEGDPFEEQSEFFKLATGYDNVFKPAVYSKTAFDGMTGEDMYTNGMLWFIKTNPEANYGSANVSITAAVDGNMYIYVTSDDAKSVTITSDKYGDKFQLLSNPHIIDLGYYEAGESARISLDCSEFHENDGYAEIYSYSCDESILNLAYNKLSESSINITKHTDTLLEGTVNVKEDSYLYSSIPYDESWSVYVDGEKVETFKIADSHLTIAIKPGEHEIKYKYTPRGLMPGIAISAATAAGICAYLFYKRQQKKSNYAKSN